MDHFKIDNFSEVGNYESCDSETQTNNFMDRQLQQFA